MRILVLTSVFLFILISAAADAVWSQEKGAVELKAVAETEVTVINDDGQEEIQRIPAAKVVPGDVVIYTVHYSNNGDEPAENLVITNPVPEHMVYLAASAEGDNSEITFSVDGGNSYDTPENLTIADPEGNQIEAKPSDYTHIRWVLFEPIEPGGTGFVNFKARLK